MTSRDTNKSDVGFLSYGLLFPSMILLPALARRNASDGSIIIDSVLNTKRVVTAHSIVNKHLKQSISMWKKFESLLSHHPHFLCR